MILPDKTDIIVIGAGVMGASIAYNLAKSSNRRVLVLDQHGPLGGMSGRTFGQVRMHYSNALTLEMAHFGMNYVANWEGEFDQTVFDAADADLEAEREAAG